MTARPTGGELLRTVFGWHGPLAVLAGASLLLVPVTAVAWLLDDRVLGGMPIWAKPMKFALSFTLYAVVLAWMTSRLSRLRRTGWWAGTVLAVASLGELVLITAQVVRGRASHFNVATPVDAAVFSAMGALVAVIYLCTLVVAVGLLLSRLGDRALTWAVRLGVLIAVAGLSVGFLMLAPTPEQARAAAEGLSETVSGGHAVGVVDGGPGLPLLGWSTTGGDLRVGHFIGMHALQLLPLLALALAHGTGLGERARTQLVQLAGVGYSGVVALTVWQALRGQPLLSPDPVTLVAAAVLLAIVGAGVVVVLRRARTAPQAPVPPAVEVPS
jgi:uncharacterized membrane protein YhaH (DUF805 family)